MEFVNPRQFEKLMRKEGYADSDIWNPEIFEDAKHEIERVAPNIQEDIEKRGLTREARRCLDKTRVFCEELSEEFRQAFLSLLKQYRKERRRIAQPIVDYLIEKKLVLPGFTITNGEEARRTLEEYGLDTTLYGGGILLVFQLPKPLSNFWWKGGADTWGSAAQDVRDTVIEWGHFYRRLMPVVWETQGRHENESGLDFQRINDGGEHDPEKYYYVWEMSEWRV